MRTLAVSIGNTSLVGGLFVVGRLADVFRIPVQHSTGAEVKRRVAAWVRSGVEAAILGSVVPTLTPNVARWIEAAVGAQPKILTADSPHGIVIGYRKPARLGIDRLAAAIGARARHPRRNIIVVDCGTASTVTALRGDGTLLGGAILPGMDLWADMLAARTAQLPKIDLRRPKRALGRSPEEAIASGIWHGHSGALREVIQQIKKEAFKRSGALVIGTGGHAVRAAGEDLFSVVQPHLVLEGLAAYAAGLSDWPSVK